MEASWEEEFENLYYESVYLEKEPKMEVARRLINIADEHKDIYKGIVARQEYIEGAAYCDQHHRAFPMLAWCFARIDEDEELNEDFEYGLMWKYKWIIEGVGDWLVIKRADVEALHQDIIKRSEKLGYGKHTVMGLELQIAFEYDDKESVEQLLEKWRTMPRDGLSDCAACVSNKMVRVLIWLKNNKEALKEAKRIISGSLSCAEVPEVTWAWVAVADLELGNRDNLEVYFNGLSKAKGKYPSNGSISGAFLWLGAVMDKGKNTRRFLNTLLKRVEEGENDWCRMWNYFGLNCALRNLKQNDVKSIKVLEMDIDEAIDHTAKKADELIDAFDKRNGSDGNREWFARMEAIYQASLGDA